MIKVQEKIMTQGKIPFSYDYGNGKLEKNKEGVDRLRQ